MTTLAPSTDYSGASVTQGGKKTFIGNLRTFVADLLGTDSSDKAAVRAQLGVVQVPVRQCVLAGAAVRSAIGTGLATNLLATTTAVRIAFPGGVGAAGFIDYVESISADVASFWSGLTASTTNYLFYNRNTTTGVVTGVASTLPYIAQDSSVAVSVVSGQHTYVYDTNTMYVGNGATAAVVQRTAEGECVTSGAAVTSVTSYAKQRRYSSGFVTPLPGVNVITVKSSNLGVLPRNTKLRFKCLSAEAGYTVGQLLEQGFVQSNGTVSIPHPIVSTANTVSFITGVTTAFQGTNPVSGLNYLPTAASWAYELIAEGGF